MTAVTGYQGFGSFHSDNVEVLVSLSDEEYKAPAIPNELSPSGSYEEFLDSVLPGKQLQGCFGRQLLDAGVFKLDQTWTFLNHGAFGAAASGVLSVASAWREYAERQPLRFFDRQLLPHLVRVLRAFSSEVGASSASDIVLVPCATQGLNAVIQSVGRHMRPGDVIFSLDVGYGSVKKMIAEVCARVGARHDEQHVDFPMGEEARDLSEEIVNIVERTLDEGRTKLAVFDAVTSNTALVLPLRKLVSVCRSRGVPVLIDGAHALGQLQVSVTELDADFYVGNCHKWYCSPRGAAFLWTNPKRKSSSSFLPRPLVISHGFGAGYTSEFLWDGNRDYSSWLALDVAIEFWKRLGPGLAAVRQYCHALLCEGTNYVVQKWATRTLVPVERCASMALVKLPQEVVQHYIMQSVPPAESESTASPDKYGIATSAHAKALQDCLHTSYHIEVPVKCLGEFLWLRLSAAVYNDMQDFVRLAEAVHNICVQPKVGSKASSS